MDCLNVLSNAWKFIDMTRSRCPSFDALLSQLYQVGDPLLFGGAVRDIALYKERATPRDFDFAIDGVDTNELEKFLYRNNWIYRKNKFGGFKLSVEGYKVDLWPLTMTWAFRQKLVSDSIAANLPATVFLNVDAVAVSLKHQKIFESGFVRAMQYRVIDIVLPENPLPALNIMRALVLRQRLNGRLSHRLRDYIVSWSQNERDPVQALRDLESHRYGHTSITEASFDQAIHDVVAV